MARTEEQMNEEMSGMAAPTGDMPMEEPMEAPETSFDMETLMGNFMELDEDRRQIAFRLIQTPAAEILDTILGEPVIARLNAQLGQGIPMGEEEPTPEGEGMMAPATEQPMADMPMEDEEATPPV